MSSLLSRFEYRGLVHEAYLLLREGLRKGTIQQRPCEECGHPASEGHHEDYRKPQEITWLCKVHHRKRHRVPRDYQFLGPDSGSRYGYVQPSMSLAGSRLVMPPVPASVVVSAT